MVHLHKSLDFLLKLDHRSLLILAQIAHVLERVSNHALDQPDDERLTPELVEEAFAKIRKLMEQQMALMRGEEPDEPS